MPAWRRCPDYANRTAKGTHRAVDRLQVFARRHRYVLRADIVQHFASVDHAILLAILRRQIPEEDIMALVQTIIASGRGVLDDEVAMPYWAAVRCPPNRHRIALVCLAERGLIQLASIVRFHLPSESDEIRPVNKNVQLLMD